MKYKLTKEALKEATWDLTNPEVDPQTGGVTHTVTYKPDLQKVFLDFKEIRDTLNNDNIDYNYFLNVETAGHL